MSKLALTIDGKPVKADPGDTVLEAARKGGIEIPSLCAHPALEPYGACRLCIVEIEGLRGFPTACTTPAADGMVVRTNTPDVRELRREILKLLLSGHTSPCLVCLHRKQCETYRPNPTKSGKTTRCALCGNRATCELRRLADELEIDEMEVPILYRNLDVERSDPFMDRDYNLCILCGRCVRICEKLHGKSAIAFVERGSASRIGTAFLRDHTQAECRFCGACVDICPTGALADRFAKWQGIPDSETETSCVLCPLGCRVVLKAGQGRIIGARATAPARDARVCAIGRFVLPQLFDSPNRLRTHRVRIPDGLRDATYEEAVAAAAERLTAVKGAGFALIAHPAATREDRYVMRKFTREVMGSEHVGVCAAGEGGSMQAPPAILGALRDGTVKAVYATGDYLDSSLAGTLTCAIAADMFRSPWAESADVVFAVAALGEVSGTFLAASGEKRRLSAAVPAPEPLKPDWQILCDIGRAMGAAGFDFESAEAVGRALDATPPAEQAPAAPDPSPLDDVSALPRFYRGHRLTDLVCALAALAREGAEREQGEAPEPAAHSESGDAARMPFQIVSKTELVPNTAMVTVYAPVVAEKCRPGQFVIGMANERSERIPYTPADWDAEAGTVTINVLERGRSSREMSLLGTGDRLAHFVGPLGRPIEIKNYGTVLCGGGCYGVGGMLPIARALKEAGNRVIVVAEAASHYLLYWQDKLAGQCDELIAATKDGSKGIKGGVQEALALLVARGEKIDQAFISGCTFMMMLVSEATKAQGIPTLTAMNPIMLDGTGMCGACRVTMGDETKFACVDGPFLDGHQIDWIQLLQRQAAFGREEVDALPQEPAHRHRCHTL
ncbi:MAG: sulfide/dihydroorotate dehydrogenase-like FAD/NAD-binding protein [Kiritimatiellae bacterium]|nr:sulfide/dihydroorotate dehydrogenase-like FAD/NAD-binding protein [Kiritimatiellia bacterium]